MRTVKIDFADAELLPNGNNLGFIGEHNATQLVIIPPAEMANSEKIATYTVAFATGGKVIHTDPILKTDEVTTSLTCALTKDYRLAVQLEGYDSEGELVVKSPLVTGLKLSPSARGTGTESDGGSADDSYSSGPGHSHTNKDVLDKLESGGTDLLYNGISLIGLKYKSKYFPCDWVNGILLADAILGGDILALIKEPLPENTVIIDFSITWLNDDGTLTEYRIAELKAKSLVKSTANTDYFQTQPFFQDMGMRAAVLVSSCKTESPDDLHSSIFQSMGREKGFTLYYLEG